MPTKSSNLNRIFDRTVRNISTAFDSTINRLNDPSDPEVQLYQSLDPEDLNKIAGKFGEDNVLEYIHKMESKKLLGGKNGVIRYRPI